MSSLLFSSLLEYEEDITIFSVHAEAYDDIGLQEWEDLLENNAWIPPFKTSLLVLPFL